jgi:tetratricopeptide (TPR) repeat protein
LFSNPAFVKEASKRYGIILDELEDAKAHLRQAKRTAMAQPFMVGLETYVERLKYVVKMWESTPFGRKALQQAEERAEKFIEKNKYGLYRGEVLLDIGTAHLVSFFDVDNGEKWLTRAAEWFDNVQQFDKDLKDFELSESVRKVSQPPKNERYRDEWTNIRLSQPKPGDFFNRRTCNWYMNSKQKDIVLLLGLIPFANNNIEKAMHFWDKLIILDQKFYEEQKQTGKEKTTTSVRLIWDLENHKTSLYATPEEMAVFDQPHLKLAVLLADIDMENENYKAAEKKYRRILDMQEVKVRKDRSAYVAYALANSLLMQFKTVEAMKIYCEFGPQGYFKETTSAPQALLNYANYMTQNTNYISDFEKGVLCYKYISAQYSETKEGQWALYLLGDTYVYIGQISNAMITWNMYLQKYPQGGYVTHVKKKLLTYKNIFNKN